MTIQQIPEIQDLRYYSNLPSGAHILSLCAEYTGESFLILVLATAANGRLASFISVVLHFQT